MTIVPARLAFDADGTPYSEIYDDVYHSRAGGIGQARHVFLGGNGLPERWRGKERFVILETGFGQGLNFLATWAAWRADPERPPRLDFLSLDKHPFTCADLATLHAAYPEVATLAAELRHQWPELTAGCQRLEFEAGAVVLTLTFGEAIAALPQFVAAVDAVFLDGFAPEKNPAMWSPRLLSEIALLGKPGTTLATWCLAAPVRAALAQAGFVIARRPGFARRQRMLVGYLPETTPVLVNVKQQPPSPYRVRGRLFRRTPESSSSAAWTPARRAPWVSAGVTVSSCGVTPVAMSVSSSTAANIGRRRAIVVGAGLAGSMICERLCARGWQVDLFERQPAAAMETSGNLTAVMLPMLSLDDNRASRLNRACYLHALRQLAMWQQRGAAIDGAACGVLQLARDAENLRRLQEIIARSGFPDSFVRMVDAAEGSLLAGATVPAAGWWFAGGAWWNPAMLCQAALQFADAHGEHLLRRHFSTGIDAIAQDAAGNWSVRDANGRTLASAPHLILASAHDILRLPQSAHLTLFRFRGQTSYLPLAVDAGNETPDRARNASVIDSPATNVPRCVVCGDGYVSPPYRGVLTVGASFHRGGEAALSAADHAANVARLGSMLPDLAATLPSIAPGGRVGFRPVSPDKLPIVGQLHHPDATPQGRDLSAVERWPGLYVATGYGARGLTWSALMAELLASELNGDPLPLEAELAATVDPARFLLRKAQP